MKNRLNESNSPYLHQHADNPVAWQPWDEEALNLARSQDKPIFLSVGYSTCHWCHVMAHESFEHDDVAASLNEYFIPIKVDREERPDIDEQYMLATQIFTRRGGWPNSVWLTPDGRPWMAGTYFPREDRHGQPGFKSILQFLNEAWHEKRDEIEQQADQITQGIREMGEHAFKQDAVELSPKLVEIAVRHASHQFDSTHGGFASAPKFPPHGWLRLLQHQYEQTGQKELLKMLTLTLDEMAKGGVYDQLGGGFHRYSTDDIWLIPHFEKMLYDNAQLIRSYAQLATIPDLPHAPEYRRIIAETFDWLQREMTSPQQAFYAALDADSEGEEGKCYVWEASEILEILGDKDGQVFNNIYQIQPSGNWTDEATGEPMHTNIPHLGAFQPALEESLKTARNKLRLVRDERPQPHLDRKIITGWNGLMITGLAEAGQLLNEAQYVTAASKAAQWLKEHHYVNGQLYRIRNEGQAAILAYLDDYAYLIEGLLTLSKATGEDSWQDWAIELMDQMIEHFEDEAQGAFFSTSTQHEALLMRSKDPGSGGNSPTANGVAASVLFELSRRTGRLDYAQKALRTLEHYSSVISSQPYLNEAVVVALAEYLADPPEVLDGHDPQQDADAYLQDGPLELWARLSHESLHRGQGQCLLSLKGKLKPGWTVYAEVEEANGLIPFNLFLESPTTVSLGTIDYGSVHQKTDELTGQTVTVYEGDFEILVPVEVPEVLAVGELILPLLIQAQACGEGRCLPPMHLKMELSLELSDKDSVLKHTEHFEQYYTKMTNS